MPSKWATRHILSDGMACRAASHDFIVFGMTPML